MEAVGIGWIVAALLERNTQWHRNNWPSVDNFTPVKSTKCDFIDILPNVHSATTHPLPNRINGDIREGKRRKNFAYKKVIYLGWHSMGFCTAAKSQLIHFLNFVEFGVFLTFFLRIHYSVSRFTSCKWHKWRANERNIGEFVKLTTLINVNAHWKHR